ncbi:MAG: AAA family ATPase [Ktedonobacteraceae bacterium]
MKGVAGECQVTGLFCEHAHMGSIFTFALQKGGAGKTTTVLSLASILAHSGKRVLCVDIDPQFNLTQGLAVDLSQVEYSVYEVLLNPERGASFAILSTDIGVDLIPATLDLSGAEMELAGQIGRELLLRDALYQESKPGLHDAVIDSYDYILIDPPPSLGVFTYNALVASSAVIVPLEMGVYAWNALPQLEIAIQKCRRLNPSLHIGGIVCTRYNKSKNLSKAIEQQAREKYGSLVFQQVIPENVKVSESPASGLPIDLYAPHSPGALAYAEVAKALIERYGSTSAREGTN